MLQIAGGSFNNAGLSPVPAPNVAAYGSLPQAPVLVSPANGATGISINPALDWTDVSNATTYGVQVSTSTNFFNFVVNVSGLSASNYNVTTNLLNNTTYFWRAYGSNGLGSGAFSTVRTFTTGMVGIINTQEIPLQFKLYQNYPNPFNPVTKIKFDLPANADNSQLRLVIYDASGSVVRELLNTDYLAGAWEIEFDGSSLASGVYFYKIEAGMYKAVNKMMIVK